MFLCYVLICILILVILFIILFYLEKYDYVGRLLKPGESHSYYTDEEETPTNKLHLENPKQCESEKLKNDSIDSSDKTETKENEAVDNGSDGQSFDSSNEKSDATKSSNGSAKQDDEHSLEK